MQMEGELLFRGPPCTLHAFSTLNSIKTDVMFVSRGVLTIKRPVRVCNEMYCAANVSNKHAVFSNK
jgi:hypothetical protein